jgi:hypothetical protein
VSEKGRCRRPRATTEVPKNGKVSAETLLHSLPKGDSGGLLGLVKPPLIAVVGAVDPLLRPSASRVDGLRSGVRLRYRPTLDIKTAQYHYNTAIRTPENEHRALGLPSPSRPFFAIRLVPAPPQSFFSRETHPLKGPPQSRFAKALAGEALQDVASF